MASIIVAAAVGLATSAATSLLFKPKPITQRIEGTRLQDTQVPKSDYGSPLPRIFGRVRVGGILMWAEPIFERVLTQSSTQGGGKGSPTITTETTTYEYYGRFAYLFLDESGVVNTIKLFLNNAEVLFDGVELWSFGAGNAVSVTIQTFEGANTPAFRHRVYFAFTGTFGYPLSGRLGNRIPAVQALLEKPQPNPGVGIGWRLDVLVPELVKMADPSIVVDVTELSGTEGNLVHGFALSGNLTYRDALERLSTAQSSYAFDAIESCGKLKFIRQIQPTVNGKTPFVKELPLSDLAVHEYGSDRPFEFEESEIPETELPAEVAITYIDPDFDYQPKTVYARRNVLGQRNVAAINLDVVCGAGKAEAAAYHLLYWPRITRKRLKFTLGPKHLDLEPGDIIKMNLHGTALLYRLTRVDVGANYVLNCEATSYLPE